MGTQAKEIAITGASGFVGRHLLNNLLKNGYALRLLVRDPTGYNPSRAGHHITVIKGSLQDHHAVNSLVDGVWAVIHLVGIIRENPKQNATFQHIHVDATQSLLKAAQSAGVSKWLHMSALGARPTVSNTRRDTHHRPVSRYHQTKWAAEQLVRKANLPYTIFRPSLIHGPGGEFTTMAQHFVQNHAPVVPRFGSGPFGTGDGGRIQPVYVEDVAEIFNQALTNPDAEGKDFALAGPDILTWEQMWRIFIQQLGGGKTKAILGVPSWLAAGMAKCADALTAQGLLPANGKFPGLPFNFDQVVMASQDSITTPQQNHQLQSVFNIKPKGFAESLRIYAPQLQPASNPTKGNNQ